MKSGLALVVVLLLAVVVAIDSGRVTKPSRDRNDQKYKVVCYWGSWSFYRPGEGKFEAENANPMICTHMVYGFAKLNPDNTIGIFDKDLDKGDEDWQSGLEWGHGMYRRFNLLRKYNPKMTTLIAIGGWNEGSDKYSAMVSNPASRKTFVDSVVKFLKTEDFDGLDVDWEYPGMQAVGDADRKPGKAGDKQNYIALIRELHEAFQPHGFILTSAVSAGKPTIDRAYDVKEMNKYLDIINLMSYDFHGGWEQKTAHNAPLHPLPGAVEIDKEFTIEYAVNYWLQLGVEPKKLVLGMPLYGRTFTLQDPTKHDIGAVAVGKGGTAGQYTRQIGILGYNEICSYLSQGYTVYRNDIQKIPYAVRGDQWIGFDDEQSIKDKVNFLKSKGLGGGMVWSIDTDDFGGHCGKGKYPLLKTISRELNGIDGPDPVIERTHYRPSTTPAPGPQPTGQPTQPGPVSVKPTPGPGPTKKPDPTGDFKCTSSGFFADPKDKTVFHECVSAGGGKFQDIVYHCGPGTVYDEVHKVCKNP